MSRCVGTISRGIRTGIIREGDNLSSMVVNSLMEACECRARGQISRHKCAICGRTEISNPELEFRFCSKCNGNYEYCNEHLFDHRHIN